MRAWANLAVTDLGKKLQSAKCEEEDDVRSHFTKLSDLREQLSAMGKDIDDQEYASILLGSLPPSYEPTTSAINAAADMTGTDITPDQVTRLVTDEYNRRIIKKGKGKTAPDEAFAANGQKVDRSKAECFNCHKIGHFKSECWAKGGDKEGQRPPRKNKDGSNHGSNHGNNNNNCNNNGNRNRNRNRNKNSDNN